NSAQVNIRWEKVRVPFTVEVKDVKAVTLARIREAVAAAKADDWRTPMQAAQYVLLTENKIDDAEANGWLEKSLKTKEVFNNLGTKARVLALQGKTQEAIAVGERAVVM